MIGYIKINKRTTSHEETLTTLGYKVNENTETGLLEVECKGFLTKEVDLRDHDAALVLIKSLVKDNKLFSYNCSFKVITSKREEAILPGVHGARFLNQIVPNGSCLVARETKPSSKPAAKFKLEDLLS